LDGEEKSEMSEPENVEGALGELDELATKGGKVRIAEVLDDFGKRSFGPFIMLPALIEITPVGGIPGIPTFLAVIISLVAVQLLFGRDHVWMPQFIQNRAVKSKKLHKAVSKLHWLDGHTRDRFEFLIRGVWIKLAAITVLLLCLTVPPLEFIPFASSAPMLAIAAIGLALIVRDGLIMILALVLAIAALLGGTYMALGSQEESGTSEVQASRLPVPEQTQGV
jgi:hypothetical protein